MPYYLGLRISGQSGQGPELVPARESEWVQVLAPEPARARVLVWVLASDRAWVRESGSVAVLAPGMARAQVRARVGR